MNADTLFSFDNHFIITGKPLTGGKHTVEFRKEGRGPLYFNGYTTNFSLEDHIKKEGLEIKVERKVYRLVPEDKEINVRGARGQAVGQKVEKYRRELLDNDDTLKSGELVEIELEIASKNDYEYLVFEDFKAAGFEPVEVRSGYTRSGGLRSLCGVPRREGRLLRGQARPRQPQRQLPPPGRNPRPLQRPPHSSRSHVRPRTPSQQRRD